MARRINLGIRIRLAANQYRKRTGQQRIHPPLPQPDPGKYIDITRYKGVKGVYLDVANVSRYQSDNGTESLAVWTRDPNFPGVGEVKRTVAVKLDDGTWTWA